MQKLNSRTNLSFLVLWIVLAFPPNISLGPLLSLLFYSNPPKTVKLIAYGVELIRLPYLVNLSLFVINYNEAGKELPNGSGFCRQSLS